jgi:transcriptional regulator with XRE-family HTH domain
MLERLARPLGFTENELFTLAGYLASYRELSHFDTIVDKDKIDNVGEMIKQARAMRSLTLQELATRSGISASQLGRIEKGHRAPSGRMLKRLAQPLGFTENELFTLAGYLTSYSSVAAQVCMAHNTRFLDPYVVLVLSGEPIRIQRAVITILGLLKKISASIPKE